MSNSKIIVLIVDDEEQFLRSMTKRLEVRNFEVLAVNRGEKALDMAQSHHVDIALVDLKMPGIDGAKTLELLKSQHPSIEVIILTGHGSIDTAVTLAQQGAFSYLQKPCSLEELLVVLENAYRKKVMDSTGLSHDDLDRLLTVEDKETNLGTLKKLKEINSSHQNS